MNSLEAVQHTSPAKYQMIFPIMDAFMHKYYSLVTKRAAIETSRLQILITVPLKTTDRVFDLFKVIPIPFPADKNS